MLLKFIRKHTKLLFIVILSFMVVPFLFWGIGSIGKQAGERKEPLRVHGKTFSLAKLRGASLDSQIILLAEFVEGNNIKTPEQFDMYKDWFNKMMDQVDLNRVAIQQLILQDEAGRYGINVQPIELKAWLENFPLFQRNGVFDMERYNSIITNYFRTWPAMFEKALMRVLTVKKLQRFIMDTVLVSQKEALEAYKERNEKAVVYYVDFIPADYIKDVGEIGEAELKGYYDEHMEEFREPEKIKVAYLLFDPATFTEQVTIAQKEIEDYYETGKKDKPLEEIKDTITETLTKQKAGEVCQEKALGISIQLTEEKRLSDMIKLGPIKETDYLSKEQGFIPEIGWAPQFIQTAWKMELETISDLLHAGDKWVIISPKEKKESRIPECEEVKDKIRDILKNKKAEELARQAAEETLNKLPKDLPFTMAVRALGLKPKKSKQITRADELFSLERKVVKNSTLVCLRKFYPVDSEKWEEEKDRFTKTYMEEKKRRFFQQWLNKLLA